MCGCARWVGRDLAVDPVSASREYRNRAQANADSAEEELAQASVWVPVDGSQHLAVAQVRATLSVAYALKLVAEVQGG